MGQESDTQACSRPNDFATVSYCALQPFSIHFSHHVNGPPDKAEDAVMSTSVWQCPCLGVLTYALPVPYQSMYHAPPCLSHKCRGHDTGLPFGGQATRHNKSGYSERAHAKRERETETERERERKREKERERERSRRGGGRDEREESSCVCACVCKCA